MSLYPEAGDIAGAEEEIDPLRGPTAHITAEIDDLREVQRRMLHLEPDDLVAKLRADLHEGRTVLVNGSAKIGSRRRSMAGPGWDGFVVHDAWGSNQGPGRRLDTIPSPTCHAQRKLDTLPHLRDHLLR